jgi:hypothetical protein
MNGKLKWRPSATDFVSLILVVLGLLLGVTVDMLWLSLFVAGALGPALLREAGLLRDRDEFQREASRRAGHRAYLAGALVTAIITVVKNRGTAALDRDAYSASAILAVMIVVYFMTYLFSFWDARAAATRILLAFGTVWLAFVALSHGLSIAGLMEGLTVAPFFLFAWLSHRWPRVAGVGLLLVTCGLFWLFKIPRAFEGNVGSFFVLVVFLLPLLLTGIALLGRGREESAAA